MAQDTAYKQNPLLKQRGVSIDFTKEQVKEVIKCSQDPEYFLSEYIKVISLDDGIVPFHPYPFQQKLIDSSTTIDLPSVNCLVSLVSL